MSLSCASLFQLEALAIFLQFLQSLVGPDLFHHALNYPCWRLIFRVQFHRAWWFHPKLIFVHVFLFCAFSPEEESVLLGWFSRLIHLTAVVYPWWPFSSLVIFANGSCVPEPFLLTALSSLTSCGSFSQMILLTIDFLLQLLFLNLLHLSSFWEFSCKNADFNFCCCQPL